MSIHLHEAAISLAELGYQIFRATPGDKVPLSGTNGFHDATRDSAQIRRWWDHNPRCNVGIATEGLLVLDIDPQGECWLLGDPERLLELAIGPMATTPRKGRHFYFRRPPNVEWRCSAGKISPGVDIRTDGGYVVAPPSVRHDGAYAWVEGSELSCPPERLPLPPAWLCEMLNAVERRSQGGAPGRSPADRSLALMSQPVRSSGSSNGLTVENIIPDGQRNNTLAALAGSMRRVGMTHAAIEAALLVENEIRVSPPLPVSAVKRIAESVSRYDPDQIAVAMTECHFEQMLAEPSEPACSVADPGPVPANLLSVPGLIDAVINHTLANAPYPDRALAFSGALALQAFLAGRKVKDESGGRTNLYILALADSGTGKEFPRKVNQAILSEVGLGHCLGDAFASGEGLEDRLAIHPAALFQTDEIDELTAKINADKDGKSQSIMTMLLKLFSQSDGLYSMRAKAGREPMQIIQPSLTMFGTAVPKYFYESLSVKMLSNGFFARMLVVETGRRGMGQRTRQPPLPANVLATARWWADLQGGAGNLAGVYPQPHLVPTDDGAAEALQSFRQYADEQYQAAAERNEQAGKALWARAGEKAQRLALVYACSACPEDLRIRYDAVQWACSFSDHQTRRMLFMASSHVSDGEFDAKCKALLQTLAGWKKRHGDSYMEYWRISRIHPWTEREHREVRESLHNRDLVEFVESATRGRPSRNYRLKAEAASGE